MLQKFFAGTAIVIIFLIAFAIIKVWLPMWRCLEKETEATELYKRFKELVEKDSQKENIEVAYGKYSFKFANIHEATIELEKIVNEALECYDKLEKSLREEEAFEGSKKRLNQIGYELRVLRLKQTNI